MLLSLVLTVQCENPFCVEGCLMLFMDERLWSVLLTIVDVYMQ